MNKMTGWMGKVGKGMVLAAAMTGCGQTNGVDFASVVPADDAVSIKVPGGGSGQPLLGARSDIYETTYNVSRGINGGVGWVLALTRAITQQQPTSQEGNRAVWGPSNPQGLERIQWRFTAEKQGEGHWTFWLEGRPKGSSDESAYKRVYEGDVTRGTQDSHRGHGTLALFFDNSQALENKSCGNGNDDVLEGRADVVFAADVNPKTVDVTFTDFRNACNANHVREPARYKYSEAEDGAGDFQFSVKANIHKATENKPLEERWTVRSRWQSSGAGRGDLTIGEGEVPADLAAANVTGNAVIATECWDEMFNVSYQTTEPTDLPQGIRDAIRPTEGNAAACVYTQAELPSDI